MKKEFLEMLFNYKFEAKLYKKELEKVKDFPDDNDKSYEICKREIIYLEDKIMILDNIISNYINSLTPNNKQND